MSAHSMVAELPDELIDQIDASILRLMRLVAARHSDACSDSSMTMPRMMLLRILAENGPTKVSDLAAHLGIKAPAASGMVDALDKLGLVRRDQDPDDRRVTLLSMSALGRSELAIAETERRKHVRHYLSVLSEDDLRDMIRIQRKLIDAMVHGDV